MHYFNVYNLPWILPAIPALLAIRKIYCRVRYEAKIERPPLEMKLAQQDLRRERYRVVKQWISVAGVLVSLPGPDMINGQWGMQIRNLLFTILTLLFWRVSDLELKQRQEWDRSSSGLPGCS